MKEIITRRLLFDFFYGKATAMQGNLIREWLGKEANQETFYRYLDEWERENPQFEPDQDRAECTFNRLLAGEIAAVTVTVPSPVRFEFVSRKLLIWVATVAASLLLAFFFRSEVMFKSYVSKAGQTSFFTLSDGTEVTLNGTSTLIAPRFGFGSDTREVFLNGEAEFKVIHRNNNARFRVLMGDGYQVEVLGTVFTAFSRRKEKRVFLTKGKVKLELPQGKQLYMKPGNYFSSDQKGSFKVTTPAEPLAITAWKEHTFYFDNTLLSDVAGQIQDRFDVKVKIIDPQLSQRRIGGIYQARQLDDLLQILTELLDIEITQKPDCIELRTTKTDDL